MKYNVECIQPSEALQLHVFVSSFLIRWFCCTFPCTLFLSSFCLGSFQMWFNTVINRFAADYAVRRAHYATQSQLLRGFRRFRIRNFLFILLNTGPFAVKSNTWHILLELLWCITFSRTRLTNFSLAVFLFVHKVLACSNSANEILAIISSPNFHSTLFSTLFTNPIHSIDNMRAYCRGVQASSSYADHFQTITWYLPFVWSSSINHNVF